MLDPGKHMQLCEVLRTEVRLSIAASQRGMCNVDPMNYKCTQNSVHSHLDKIEAVCRELAGQAALQVTRARDDLAAIGQGVPRLPQEEECRLRVDVGDLHAATSISFVYMRHQRTAI